MPRITQPVLFFVLFLLPLNWPAYEANAQDSQRPKKLIATGWDHVDPQRLAANLQDMEGRPFDGVVIRIAGQTPEGRSVPLQWAFQKDRWEQAWFQESVETLRQVRSDKLTDNFVLLNANPGNVDWFDDEGWTAVVEHCRIAAWCAKQSGAKGILFDPEPYAPPNAAFHYGAQPQREEHSFGQYYEQARLRGRQMMQAVAGEYPEITLFCYFMNSVVASATGQADPRSALKSSHYGLYPALIDGWLDAAPSTATFVDGCESAYRYNSTEQYLESAVAIKGACQELVSPENRAKHRAQVQVSFGIYLDAYWNPKDSEWGTWYIDGLGRPRVERLRTNTATALRVADEYVWVYGEKFRWWPTPNGRVRQETWPEALAGCDKVLSYVRDPVEYARRELADLEQNGELPNLLANGEFTSETAATADGKQVPWSPGRPPAGWSAWQEADSKGDFTWDREVGLGAAGSARASGVAGGCFLQGCPAAPGDRFAVRSHVRTEGRSDVWIRVRWQTDESKWTAETKDRIFMPQASAGPWREILGVVEVPEGAGRLVVLLGVAGQAGAEDVAWFDNVLLYRLP
ncbi:MAG: hypothetical protein GXX96_17185 [Planctomycetaceae bacterium]|nr:hypothetical protein [Planctomycetaceae bacterium]